MKKIKLILPAILLFVGLQAKAAIYSEGDEKFKDYQDATLALVYNDNMYCGLPEYQYPSYFNGERVSINALISKAQTVVVYEGAQPVLTFYTNMKNPNDDQNIYRMGVAITADETNKKIVSITANVFRDGRVNSGDLLNPVMSDGLLFFRECVMGAGHLIKIGP